MAQSVLNYRPSNSAVYYTPPKRIQPGRTLAAFAGAAVAVMVGAFVYGRIQPWLLKSFELQIGGVIAAAMAVGLLGIIAVHYGRVRAPVVAGFIGTALSLLSLYVMWLAWLHHVLGQWNLVIGYVDLVTQPRAFMRLIRLVNAVGTWSYDRNDVCGVPLLILWLLEAGLVLTAGVLMPLVAMGGDDPECRECGRRCKPARDLPRFSADRADEMVAAVESREFASLAEHAAPEHEDDPELSLRLLSCPNCGQTHVLTLNLIGWMRESTGQVHVAVKPMVNQLLITAEEARELRAVCKQVVEQREARRDDVGDGVGRMSEAQDREEQMHDDRQRS